MDPYVEKDEEDEELLHRGGYQSCPMSLNDHNGVVNGALNQPHSLQNIPVIARDPSNVKSKSTSDAPKLHGSGSNSRFHLSLFSKDTKHKCSRCNRKFTDKSEYMDHTTKCIQ